MLFQLFVCVLCETSTELLNLHFKLWTYILGTRDTQGGYRRFGSCANNSHLGAFRSATVVANSEEPVSLLTRAIINVDEENVLLCCYRQRCKLKRHGRFLIHPIVSERYRRGVFSTPWAMISSWTLPEHLNFIFLSIPRARGNNWQSKLKCGILDQQKQSCSI